MKRNQYIDELLHARVGTGLDGVMARLRGTNDRAKPEGAKLGPPAVPPPSFGRRRAGTRVMALERVSVRNDERSFEAIQHNSRSIDALAANHDELTARVAALEVESRGDLLRAFAGKLASLERRVGAGASASRTALASSHRALEATVAKQGKALRASTYAARIQKVNAAAATLQNAAYGTKGSPIAPNNLLLAANQLVWSFLGDLLRITGLVSPATANIVAALAPVGSLAAAELVLGRQQHERFVSGIADLRPPSVPPVTIPLHAVVLMAMTSSSSASFLTVDVSLRPYIASGAWPSFARRSDVAVTATVVSPSDPRIRVHAEVVSGTLRITVARPIASTPTRVAWLVDTQDPDA